MAAPKEAGIFSFFFFLFFLSWSNFKKKLLESISNDRDDDQSDDDYQHQYHYKTPSSIEMDPRWVTLSGGVSFLVLFLLVIPV